MPECYTCSRSGIKYDDEIDFAHLASAHPMGTEEVLDTPVHGNTPQPPQKLSEPSFASENFQSKKPDGVKKKQHKDT